MADNNSGIVESAPIAAKNVGADALQTERYSYFVYIVKAFAILFVIAAHLNVVLEGYGLAIKIFSIIWRKCDIISVPLFLIFSGYYYRRQANDSKVFWHKKLNRIVVPWLIISTLTYIVKVINERRFSVVAYLKWVTGYRTWYYFVIILLVFFVLFKFLNKDIFLYLFILVNVIYGILEECGINFSYDSIIGFFLNNLLNKIGYFAFGLLLKRYGLDIRLFLNKKLSVIIFFISLAFVSLCIFSEAKGLIDVLAINVILNILCKVVSIYVIFCIAWFLSGFKPKKVFIFIGQSTYFIYLIHMQIVQFALNKLPISVFSVIFKPIFGFIIMIILSYLICILCKKVFKSKRLLTIIGLK